MGSFEVTSEGVSAVSGLLTVLVAAVAAYYAWQAAIASRRQATATEGQLEAAEEQLAIARNDSAVMSNEVESNRDQERALRRREIQSALDALTPEVLIRLLGFDPLYRLFPADSSVRPAGTLETLPSGDDRIYLVRATVSFLNVSKHIARVAIQEPLEEFVDPSDGSSVSGRELILAPGEERRLLWSRNVLTMQFRGGSDSPTPAHAYELRARFWVRDLGVQVRDTLELVAGWQFFRADGSTVIVDPAGGTHPGQPAAEPAGPRVYERL